MGKGKKKNKPKQPQSLKDRLGARWEARKWEGFASLYMRDRDASDMSPFAGRLPVALFNAMTQALFFDRNTAGAAAIAEQILREDDLGDDAEVIRACASVAMDFASAMSGRSLAKTKVPKGVSLPPQYARLREGLSSVLSEEKTREKETPEAQLLDAMGRQFKSLHKAKNLAPFTNFFQTADELYDLTNNSPSADVFRAIATVAEFLREINKGAPAKNRFQNASMLDNMDLSSGIASKQTHPAFLALWAFLCESGAKRFGPEWADAARALQINFVAGLDKFKFAAENFENSEDCFEFGLFKMLKAFDWTDAERYVISYLIIVSLFHNDPADFAELPWYSCFMYFKALDEIGRRWRPGNPWNENIKQAFSAQVHRNGLDMLDSIKKYRPPFDLMLPQDALFFLIHQPALKKDILSENSYRLPFELDERQLADAAYMIMVSDASADAMNMVLGVLSDKSRVELERIIDEFKRAEWMKRTKAAPPKSREAKNRTLFDDFDDEELPF